VTWRAIARQRLGKHIPATNNTQATIGELPFLCNDTVFTIEEELFSKGPPRDYISSTEQNQIRTRMEVVPGTQGRRVRLKIDCDYE
jgi:hypothetical protein